MGKIIKNNRRSTEQLHNKNTTIKQMGRLNIRKNQKSSK